MLKSKFKIIITVWLSLLGATVLSSCKEDKSSDGYPDDLCVDFATFVSTSDSGTVFTLRKNGDSPLITLTAAVKVDTSKLKPDTRVLIQYVPSGGQAPYESGPITLYSIGLIVTGDIDIQPLPTIESWGAEPIKLTALTRSGEYLDVWAQGDYDSKITRFCLAADDATLSDEYPQLYLVFMGDKGIGYPHQLYASFSLGSVWELPTCKGVTINYQTKDGLRSQTISKTTNN